MLLHKRSTVKIPLIAIFLALTVGGALVFTAEPATATTPTATFPAPVVASQPQVTGLSQDFGDPSWVGSSSIADFTNLTTRVADKSTTVQYAFGPSALVVAFKIVQDKITAQQTANNVGLGLDDYAQVSLDTSINGSAIYNFQLTPHAVRYQSSSESTRYDPSWLGRAAIIPGGWLAEFVIPYNILKTSQRSPVVWRINFARYVAMTQQTFTWTFSPTMVATSDSSFWPHLTSVPTVAGGRTPANAEIFGLADAGPDRSVAVSPSGQNIVQQPRNIGADFNVPVSSGLNAVGTLNPDFSNVELDQQVIAPQEFRRQYTEYRPFFTQGANFLPTAEVFYSPNIGPFFRGEKVEGIDGPFGIGVLNDGGNGRSDTAYQLAFTTLDQQFGATFGGAQVDTPGAHDLTNEVTASYVNLKSRLGYAIGESHETGTYTNGADRTFAYISEQRPNYQASAAYYDISPTYSPLDSYLAQNDTRGPQITAGLNSTESNHGAIKDSSISFYGDRYTDLTGAVRQVDDILTGSLTFRDLIGISLYSGVSNLRSYSQYFPVYADGLTTPYNTRSITLTYLANTASATSLIVSTGPFGGSYLHQIDFSTLRPIVHGLSASIDYDLDTEDPFNGPRDGQVLRRIALVKTFSADENIAINYRTVSGNGGFSEPGTNLAVSYKHRFGKGSNLYAEFGSPAAITTLNRVIIKYVQFIGSGAGE